MTAPRPRPGHIGKTETGASRPPAGRLEATAGRGAGRIARTGRASVARGGTTRQMKKKKKKKQKTHTDTGEAAGGAETGHVRPVRGRGEIVVARGRRCSNLMPAWTPMPDARGETQDTRQTSTTTTNVTHHNHTAGSESKANRTTIQTRWRTSLGPPLLLLLQRLYRAAEVQRRARRVSTAGSRPPTTPSWTCSHTQTRQLTTGMTLWRRLGIARSGSSREGTGCGRQVSRMTRSRSGKREASGAVLRMLTGATSSGQRRERSESGIGERRLGVTARQRPRPIGASNSHLACAPDGIYLTTYLLAHVVIYCGVRMASVCMACHRQALQYKNLLGARSRPE